jgi:asparagine synthase (glutamine-hydrolysing)
MLKMTVHHSSFIIHRSDMCGISVLIAPNASPGNAAILRAMHAPIRHRGPDDERAVVLQPDGTARRLRIEELEEGPAFSIGMAFRRLKIVDLSDASAQPMASQDGKTWIVFNGEIYNFRELARELAGRGHQFTTHGDTEVLLAAYQEWGTACFTRLEGMWAAVIVDTAQRRVVASRDRFGIKPLYFAVDGERVLLASEAKQLLPVIKSPRPDLAMARAHLAGMRYPVMRESFWLGIEQVPPATSMELEFGGERRIATYWSLDDFTAEGRRAYDDSLEELRGVLAEAVESHTVSDVRLGSLLSGGLDSAVVAGLLHRSRGATFPTFSFGFRERAPEVCELPVVDDVVRMKGFENHETTFDEGWIIANAERAVRAIEEPPMAMAALAQYRTFELVAARGTTVVLDGQGADEIFAGYPYHERDFLLDRLAHADVRGFVGSLRAIGKKNRRSMSYLVTRGLVMPWLAQRRDRYSFLAGEGEEPDYVNFDGARDPSRLNRRLHFDVKWGNVRIVLGLGDRNSMAHSVESRVPYFDRRLVELAFSMPDTFKAGNGDRKRILRDIGRELLPPSLTEQAGRLGYGTPMERFVRGALRPWVTELVSDERFSRSPLFESPAAMRRFVDDYFAGRHRDVGAVWRLAALAVWRNAFEVNL